jgi:antitoxin HigA-1
LTIIEREDERMNTVSTNISSIHPGEILLEEFMKLLSLTAYRVVKVIGVPAPRVNDIVVGKRAISADTALHFGKYFGLPAQFWLNLQNDYDLRNADKTAVSPCLRSSR